MLQEQGRRLAQLMKHQHWNQSQMAEFLGCKQPLISNVLKGEQPLSSQNKIQLHKRLGMNILWFDEGTGEMFGGNSNAKEVPQDDFRILSIVVDRDDNELAKAVPAYAQAGYLTGFRDPEFVEQLPDDNFLYPTNDGTYRTFEIVGDSMEPAFYETDFVRGKFLDPAHWRNKLRIGEIFIVVHKEGIICKQLKDHNPETGDIVLRSFNDLYEDRHLNLAEVYELWYYKGYFSRRSFRDL